MLKILVHLLVMAGVYAGALLYLTPYLHQYLQSQMANSGVLGSMTTSSSVRQPYAHCFQTQKHVSKWDMRTNHSMKIVSCIKREAEGYLRLIGGA